MEPRSAAAHRSDNGGLAAPATWRERLRDMSREIPAFTGVYLDSSGNVAISIARDSIAGPDVTRIRAWAHQIAGLRTDGPTTLRRVKYNYATLYENLTTFQQSSLPRDPALNLIRIDEMAGKIVLGYSSTAAAERAKPDIADLGIPEDMVRFERTAAATPDTKLTQVFRPTRGGLRVASSTQFCSLGFNVHKWATLGDTPQPQYFLTASHCAATPNRDPFLGEIFYQDSISRYRVGVSEATAQMITTAHCHGLTPCLDADVMAIRYDDTVSVGFGAVANVDASKNITGVFLVGSPAVTGAVLNQGVVFVGYASGKSTGTVLETCADKKLTLSTALYGTYNVWVLCEYGLNYTATSGDSGGPVFVPYNASQPLSPAMVGIHSSSDASNGRKYASSMNQIDLALGFAYAY